MNFDFTHDQNQMRGHLNDLLSDVCTPEYVTRCDETCTPPSEGYASLAKHGWLGLSIPEEYGGSGGSTIDLAILLEECGRHFEELALWVFRSLTYGGYAVLRDGSDKQKRELVPQVAAGKLSVCFGLREPDSGSDAAALKPRATMESDGSFQLNGQK